MSYDKTNDPVTNMWQDAPDTYSRYTLTSRGVTKTFNDIDDVLAVIGTEYQEQVVMYEDGEIVATLNNRWDGETAGYFQIHRDLEDNKGLDMLIDKMLYFPVFTDGNALSLGGIDSRLSLSTFSVATGPNVYRFDAMIDGFNLALTRLDRNGSIIKEEPITVRKTAGAVHKMIYSSEYSGPLLRWLP